MEDSQRREILEQIDQLTQQIKEHHYEETRRQTDELHRRLKDCGENGEGNDARLGSHAGRSID